MEGEALGATGAWEGGREGTEPGEPSCHPGGATSAWTMYFGDGAGEKPWPGEKLCHLTSNKGSP